MGGAQNYWPSGKKRKTKNTPIESSFSKFQKGVASCVKRGWDSSFFWKEEDNHGYNDNIIVERFEEHLKLILNCIYYYV